MMMMGGLHDTTQFPIYALEVLQLQTIQIAQSIFYIRNCHAKCALFSNEWSIKISATAAAAAATSRMTFLHELCKQFLFAECDHLAHKTNKCKARRNNCETNRCVDVAQSRAKKITDSKHFERMFFFCCCRCCYNFKQTEFLRMECLWTLAK